ncbi:hypothetical protein FGB62_320g016 [Gracilaria domingensis]|nr:hypothetical protein FGB62_320g016 [Gracilaria domingensis]
MDTVLVVDDDAAVGVGVACMRVRKQEARGGAVRRSGVPELNVDDDVVLKVNAFRLEGKNDEDDGRGVDGLGVSEFRNEQTNEQTNERKAEAVGFEKPEKRAEAARTRAHMRKVEQIARARFFTNGRIVSTWQAQSCQ